MTHTICIKFRGNLARFFGQTRCAELSECTTIGRLLEELLEEKALNKSIDLGSLGVVSRGLRVDKDEDACMYDLIEVFHLFTGG